jgi:hypothetical protein
VKHEVAGKVATSNRSANQTSLAKWEHVTNARSVAPPGLGSFIFFRGINQLVDAALDRLRYVRCSD